MQNNNLLFERDFIANMDVKKTVSSIISESKRCPLKLHERFSDFGDSVCGEPLRAQRLVMDFTPVENMDNEFVQEKCCAFWELISSHPELRNLMAMPEQDVNEYDWSSSTVSESSSESVKSDSERPIKEKTAVSMLEFVDDKDIIHHAFEAKIPQAQCVHGSNEYLEGDTGPPAIKIKPVCSCNLVCQSCKKKQPEDERLPHPVREVRNMCKIFKEWDKEHPKSMEPPGHPPSIKD